MFGEIKIGNKRKGGISSLSGFTSIDCDRKNPILGNKYILHDYLDDQERESVINSYKIDYEEDWKIGGPMKEATLKLARRAYKGENLLLNCWCYGDPTKKPCHVELIKAKIEEILEPYRK